jgi:hypothetical protein
VPAICSPHQEASSDTTLTREDIEIGLLRTIGTGLGLPGMELVPTGWAILDSRVAKARRFVWDLLGASPSSPVKWERIGITMGQR